MRNFVKKVLFCISTILIFIVLGWMANTITQHIISDIRIENFKNKGVYQEELSSSSVKFYKIETGEELGYTKVNEKIYPGAKADVLVAKKSNIGIPFVEEFITFFAGGHSSLATGNYADYSVNVKPSDSIEATGLEGGENLSRVTDRYYWTSQYTYDEVIVVRGNNMDEKMKDEVVSNCFSLLGDPYNYSFTFDIVNKSYCSDLISKSFKSVGIDFNKNGFWTTIYDLLVSSDCHISYYHYYKDNVKYIYYVG